MDRESIDAHLLQEEERYQREEWLLRQRLDNFDDKLFAFFRKTRRRWLERAIEELGTKVRQYIWAREELRTGNFYQAQVLLQMELDELEDGPLLTAHWNDPVDPGLLDLWKRRHEFILSMIKFLRPDKMQLTS